MAAALAETAHLNADSKLENGSRKRRGINTPAQSRRTGTLVIFDALGQATQRARAVGRMRLVESILEDKDWRGKAWYLERTDPAQLSASCRMNSRRTTGGQFRLKGMGNQNNST